MFFYNFLREVPKLADESTLNEKEKILASQPLKKLLKVEGQMGYCGRAIDF